ncbi:MAG: GNAT family N-acetyltransferase [Armatimonadetes bacterium]|nr:GNAT family N-acetyltransferase [Armatimonadota bacterium]
MAITLRPVGSSDEPALTALIKASPDTGLITMGALFHPDAYTVYARQARRLGGLVASAPGEEGLAGAGFFSLRKLAFEGQIRPAAYLFSLVVHPGWRRQGIGRRLVRELMAAARDQIGPDGVLYAHIQSNNTGSLRIFETLFDRMAGPIDFGGPPMRRRPMKRRPDVIVRPANHKELPLIAEGLNQFYADYDLFPPETEESLKDWLDDELHHYHVAADAHGQVLAGIGVFDEPALRETEILDMPVPLKLLNRLVGLVPRDGVLRRLVTSRVWFRPGYLAAAQCLWQTLRFELREKGNMLGVGYDHMDGGLRRVFGLPRWLPMAHTTVALCYPKHDVPPTSERTAAQRRLIYAQR